MGTKEDESRIWALIKWFAMDSLGNLNELNRVDWKNWESMEDSRLAKRKCGYDLLTQILWMGHMKSIDREGEKRERQHATHGHDQTLKTARSKLLGDRKPSLPDENAGRRKVYAQETMAVVCHDPAAPIDSRTVVHETEQALHVPAPSSKMKKKNRAKPKSEPSKDDERDLAIRAKYPNLDTIVTASPVVNETSSKGVFGVGDSPLFKQNEVTATEDEDFIDEASPSILSRNKTNRNRVANKGDWIQCHEEKAGVEDRKRKKTRGKTAPSADFKMTRKQTNKWGIETSEATLTQSKRYQTKKKGKLDSFIKGKVRPPKRFSGQDDDLQRAIRLSKEEAERHAMLEFNTQDDDLLRAIELSKEEAERHPMLEPVKTERMSRAVSPIDDAFDVLAAERPSSKPSK